MNKEELCVYCDNKLMPSDTQCSICDAVVNHNFMKTDKPRESQETQTRAAITAPKVSDNPAPKYGDSVPVKSILIARCVFEPEIRLEPVKFPWTCSFCTFVNDSSHLCCDACFKEKTVTEVGKEFQTTWPCIKCTFVNANGSLVCDSCTTEKETAITNEPNEERQKNDLQRALPTNHEWECMKCNYVNSILSLTCFTCLSNNQIYRPCTECMQYFIMNDMDKSCTNCLVNGGQRMNGPKKGNTSVGESTRNMSKNKDMPSLKSIFRVKSKWQCSQITCKNKNSDGADRCKKCSLARQTGDDLVSAQGEADKCEDKDGKKEVKEHLDVQKQGPFESMKSRLSIMKHKKWYCAVASCRTGNSKGDNCKNCGRNRNSDDCGNNMVGIVEGGESSVENPTSRGQQL